MSDADNVVRTMLGEAGLPASEEEIEGLVTSYPEFKAGVESLYGVTDARYESPAVKFDPDPTFSDWG
jgi:hypothetical protein